METIDETAITNHAPLPNQGIAEHESFTPSTDDCRRDTMQAFYFIVLAERQGRQIPERITERIRAIAQGGEEDLAVLIDPANTPAYSYRPQSQMTAAC
jgi:hypothetical protein